MKFLPLKYAPVRGGWGLGLALFRGFTCIRSSTKFAEITVFKLAYTTVRFALLKTLRSRGLAYLQQVFKKVCKAVEIK